MFKKSRAEWGQSQSSESLIDDTKQFISDVEQSKGGKGGVGGAQSLV